MGTSLERDLAAGLWPLLEDLLASYPAAGLAVAVVRGDEEVHRAFGVRDVRTGDPVTPRTMFHLASVSKPFVATAVVSLATRRDGGRPLLDLDAPVVEWIPELTLADGRQAEVTARGLLAHTSGLPDVSEYGWHDPRLGDDALGELARSLSGWRLQAAPGSAYSYSNVGYDLLGLMLSRALGTTFEDAVRRQVLAPLGMRESTFLLGEVPAGRAAAPHVGMPLVVPDRAYPYTRRHAPSSTLHATLVELCRWLRAHLDPDPPAPLDAGLLALVRRPAVDVDDPPWDEAAGLGWALGRYRGHRTQGHSGADPGFGSRLTLVPELRTGVVVLGNANTLPLSSITKAALDVALAGPAPGEGAAGLRSLLPPVTVPVAEALAGVGHDAAVATFHRLAAAEPVRHDLDDEVFDDAVWGAIELHRTDLVRPLLRVWTAIRPGSSGAWASTGWAHQVDGDVVAARAALHRASELDPANEAAARLLADLPPA